ncbi:phospholipase A2 inhibitor and Ly6/PLAUR domain-containing protein isoform X2 [Diceros bicornis minor]|uniref:phospholipase A2 inhibitor and Ly6/PLAUR domain-containing protein isoform X2 n=1 Tax=Diceros bicornis minor TaxID=77932 RepID=UPI0026EFB3EE|nr:phospholipase A2 inhibitor and Ly6/PLAUR domain-containing protein isoform X2 [Diceros bicornis minor]
MSPSTLLLASALLCTLLGLGCPLSCEMCRASGPTCSGKTKTCEAGKDACVIVVGESSTKGRHSVNTYKGCMKFSDCYSGFVSTTTGSQDYMVSTTYCCQSDGCNQGSVPRIINAKFATRGCATESACYAKAGAQVPSASYLYFLRRADCLPAPWPPGRAE